MKQSILGLGLMILVSTLSIAQDYQTYDEGIAKFRAKEYEAVSIADNHTTSKEKRKVH